MADGYGGVCGEHLSRKDPTFPNGRQRASRAPCRNGIAVKSTRCDENVGINQNSVRLGRSALHTLPPDARKSAAPQG